MVSLFEGALEGSDKDVRTKALSLSALLISITIWACPTLD